MRHILSGAALVALTAALGACVYYPNGPYGPGYGPYHPAAAPPPPPNYGPPPGPQGGYGPPPGEQYGPPPGSGPQASAPRLSPSQIAKMNDPNWCNAHPYHCRKLHSEYAASQGGPPPGGQYGPPPQQGQYGPPPNAQGGPPPGDDDE